MDESFQVVIYFSMFWQRYGVAVPSLWLRPTTGCLDESLWNLSEEERPFKKYEIHWRGQLGEIIRFWVCVNCVDSKHGTSLREAKKTKALEGQQKKGRSKYNSKNIW